VAQPSLVSDVITLACGERGHEVGYLLIVKYFLPLARAMLLRWGNTGLLSRNAVGDTMKTLKSWIAIALFAFSGLASANIIYSFSYAFAAGGSASGTITTDGTIGALSAANVLDWTMNLNGNPGGLFTLHGPFSGNNSGLQTTGGLVGSLSAITFDFSGGGYALFQNPSPGSGINYLCYASALCGNFTNAINMGTNVFGVNTKPQTGVQVVATARPTNVPEPGTAALLGLGVVAMWRARRKR
jgi:hypothetical protein